MWTSKRIFFTKILKLCQRLFLVDISLEVLLGLTLYVQEFFFWNFSLNISSDSSGRHKYFFQRFFRKFSKNFLSSYFKSHSKIHTLTCFNYCSRNSSMYTCRRLSCSRRYFLKNSIIWKLINFSNFFSNSLNSPIFLMFLRFFIDFFSFLCTQLFRNCLKYFLYNSSFRGIFSFSSEDSFQISSRDL